VSGYHQSEPVSDRTHPPVLQLRLLAMPLTGHPFRASPNEIHDTAVAEWHVPEYNVFGTCPVDAERVFWYRWITGHQISFALWRAMCDVVWNRPDDLPTKREIDLLTACVDGYSAMLLYSSTIPREHYHARTRVRMALQHPSFSGTWAPDYRPLHRLFRGRFPWQSDPSCVALGEAIARNSMTHDHIADHLVPNGRSLLQQSIGAPGVSVSQEKEELYDNLFLTVRRPVSHAELVAQLDSRSTELATDLEYNGLYPNVDGHHHPVVVGPSGGVMRPLVTGVLQILDRAARLVSEMQLEEVSW
jgi:L-tyrosine peroxygenase